MKKVNIWFVWFPVGERKHYTFGEAQWLVWVLLFRVASNAKQPENMTSKLMINIWACLCLVFMASYTANLGEYQKLKSIILMSYNSLLILYLKTSRIYDNQGWISSLKRSPRSESKTRLTSFIYQNDLFDLNWLANKSACWARASLSIRNRAIKLNWRAFKRDTAKDVRIYASIQC